MLLKPSSNPYIGAIDEVLGGHSELKDTLGKQSLV